VLLFSNSAVLAVAHFRTGRVVGPEVFFSVPVGFGTGVVIGAIDAVETIPDLFRK